MKAAILVLLGVAAFNLFTREERGPAPSPAPIKVSKSADDCGCMIPPNQGLYDYAAR